MDFADILNQWDQQQKKTKTAEKKSQKPNKKANAPTKEEKEAQKQGYTYEQIMEEENNRHLNPMTIWLNHHGIQDKDREEEKTEEEILLNNREYLRSMRPEAFIDLHGLNRDEAWSRMEAFIADCKRKGLKKVLIIHGKGNHSNGSDPVLGPLVRLFIEKDKRLGSSGHPDRNHGGLGATWVIIR